MLNLFLPYQFKLKKTLIIDFVLTIIITLSFTLTITRVPVHAVSVPVPSFVSGAWLLFLLDSVFSAIISCLVYIGAVAVSFLSRIISFLPYSENLNLIEGKKNNFFLSFFFLLSSLNFSKKFFLKSNEVFFSLDFRKNFDEVFLTNNGISLKDFGYLLYTYFGFLLILISFLLFLTMFGSILLTLLKTNDIKKQEIFKQLKRENNLLVYSKNI